MTPGKPVDVVAKIWPTKEKVIVHGTELPGKSFNWAVCKQSFLHRQYVIHCYSIE